MWVFDDASAGLNKEAFVCGADDIITRISEDIPNRDKGFVLIFSERAIPEATLVVHHHKRGERGVGDYYIHKPTGMVGWLCPALLKYFPKPPRAIYATAKAISPPMVGVGRTNKQIQQQKEKPV